VASASTSVADGPRRIRVNGDSNASANVPRVAQYGDGRLNRGKNPSRTSLDHPAIADLRHKGKTAKDTSASKRIK
jgi:hypothetical protein